MESSKNKAFEKASFLHSKTKLLNELKVYRWFQLKHFFEGNAPSKIKSIYHCFHRTIPSGECSIRKPDKYEETMLMTWWR